MVFILISAAPIRPVGALSIPLLQPASYLAELITRMKKEVLLKLLQSIGSEGRCNQLVKLFFMSSFALIAGERFYMKIECPNNGMCRKRSHDAIAQLRSALEFTKSSRSSLFSIPYGASISSSFLLARSSPPLNEKCYASRPSKFGLVSGSDVEHFYCSTPSFTIPNAQIEKNARVNW